MSALRDRFLYGTILLSGVLGLLWVDQHFDTTAGFLLLTLLFSVVSWIELRRVMDSRSAVLGWYGGGLMVMCLVYGWYLRQDLDWLPPVFKRLTEGYLVAIAVGMPLGGVLLSFRSEPTRERAQEIALSSVGFVYLVVPMTLFLALRASSSGEWWIFITVVLIKCNDIGGFLAGRYLGRTPLSRLSPKKTLEGSIGGLLLGTAALIGLYALLIPHEGGLPLPALVVLGVSVGVASQVGDLSESFIKRAFGVKDSGALVPAYGGTLDMIDSVLFGAPALYFVKKLLEL